MFTFLIIVVLGFLVARGMWREYQRVDSEQNALEELSRYDYRRMQDWVGDWADRVLKPKGVTLAGTYKHLVKEVNELGKEFELLETLPIEADKTELLERIAKELVDIDIVTCHAAHQLSIELASHFIEKMHINEKRSWHQADADGASQHVEGT